MLSAVSLPVAQSSIWLIQNGFLLVSASYRLLLYVNVYSLTRLRLAAACGMVLVFVGLISIAVRVFRQKSTNWLITTNFFSVLTALLIVLVVNMSSFIATFNLKHCREVSGDGSYLDIDYLQRLGTSSIPALIRYSRISDYDPGLRQAQVTLKRLETKLDKQLKDWRGWSWERQKYRQLLATSTLLVQTGDK